MPVETESFMQFISSLREGDKIHEVYLVKEKRTAQTRNGKPYENLTLQDKTGTIDAKIWDPMSPAIYEFDQMDFVEIKADVTSYNNSLQVNIRAARPASEGDYVKADYLPTSEKDVDSMFDEILSFVGQVENIYLKRLLELFFIEDKELVSTFKSHSAAKSVHHSFSGGLLEHTLSVVRFCGYLADHYPLINRDLLFTAALCHDIGKTRELSDFPTNDYTDEGQLLGHIIIGSEMISEKIKEIPDFPEKVANQLKHCILAHHGTYEFGSPKLPSTIEALAVNLADNADAKLQIMIEALGDKGSKADADGWIGYNRFFTSNIRKTDI